MIPSIQETLCYSDKRSVLRGHAVFRQRRINDDAKSWRCIDRDTPLYKRDVPAGWGYVDNY